MLVHAARDAAAARWVGSLLDVHPQISCCSPDALRDLPRERPHTLAGMLLSERASERAVAEVQRVLQGSSSRRVLQLVWNNPLRRAVHWLQSGADGSDEVRAPMVISMKLLRQSLAAGNESDANCMRLARLLSQSRGPRASKRSTRSWIEVAPSREMGFDANFTGARRLAVKAQKHLSSRQRHEHNEGAGEILFTSHPSQRTRSFAHEIVLERVLRDVHTSISAAAAALGLEVDELTRPASAPDAGSACAAVGSRALTPCDDCRGTSPPSLRTTLKASSCSTRGAMPSDRRATFLPRRRRPKADCRRRLWDRSTLASSPCTTITRRRLDFPPSQTLLAPSAQTPPNHSQTLSSLPQDHTGRTDATGADSVTYPLGIGTCGGTGITRH